MDIEHFNLRFMNNAQTIQGLARDLTVEQARWKPDAESWSILEVINHLYDEEREDFRQRLDLVLHHPDKNWPSINPPAWVVERKYNQRDLDESLANFLNERQTSLNWLSQLSDPNWQAVYDHPIIGQISAADLLAAWLAHDFLHIRQLTELHFAHHAQQFDGRRIEYAGEW